MQIVRGIQNLITPLQGCVLTLGNFDGVHRGHQQLIACVVKTAKARQLPAVVVVFEPQPQAFFHPHHSPARLSRLREKLMFFKDMRIDCVLILRFNAALAALSAEGFVSEILVKRLNVQHVILGEDGRFGAHHRGDVDFLIQQATYYHFTAEKMSTLWIEEESASLPVRISSTLLRQTLVAGNLSFAKKLLGHFYTLSGRISYGAQRGRTLGFPTINMDLHRTQSPLLGIFAVRVSGLGDRVIEGVANMGYRPTIKKDADDSLKPILEVYLFDFNEIVYGRFVCVEFIHKIRDEFKFSSIEALKIQIGKDVEEAKRIFTTVPST